MRNDKMRVYFTVDTETSMAGAWNDSSRRPLPLERSVFGRDGSRQYGIPLIMDILEEHGFRGTFFIEVLCSHILGREEVRRVFECVEQRGHDAQLHLHPVYWYYRQFLDGGVRMEKDLMFQLPLEEQDRLFGMGVELFREFTGRTPRAYRAGCYGAAEPTLGVMRRYGIELDSSYNLAYLDRSCGFQYRPLNGPRMLEGVHEFPVTNFRVASVPGTKSIEVGAVSPGEILAAMESLERAGCRDVVISLHSFSFLKTMNGQQCRPDRVAIHRFRKLCRTLAESPSKFEVPVMGSARVPDGSTPRGSDHVPCLSWVRPFTRKLVQGLNRVPWV
jgi:hypothetical protein